MGHNEIKVLKHGLALECVGQLHLQVVNTGSQVDKLHL